MSTLQTIPRHRESIRTALLALTAVIAIAIALLILPTGHRTSAPSAGSIAHRPSQAAALTARTAAPAGRFRDPATHALICSQAVPIRSRPTRGWATFATPPLTSSCACRPHGTARDNIRPNHSRGRIIP